MGEATAKLVLASASPRRLALLERAGLVPDILHPSDVDETPRHRETPRRLSIRLAEEKAEKAKSSPQLQQIAGTFYLIAADTVVGLGRRCLPKAESRDVAEDCLWLLSGRSHWVYSTVVVLDPKGRASSRCCETKVRFKRLSREDVKSYLDSEEWRGKAGGYAIQGRAESFVRYMAGSYSAVMGLPMYETVHLLTGAGYPVQARWAAAGPTGI